MQKVKMLLNTGGVEDKSKTPKHRGSLRTSLRSGANLSVRLSQQSEKEPILHRKSSSKPATVTYKDDEKKDENPTDTLTPSKTKFKGLIQQKPPSTKYSMREMEKLLKDQAAQRKALEQQNSTVYRPLKMNVEDRYSDEGELDESKQHENTSVRMLDKWQLDNKKKKFASAVEQKVESIAKVIKKSVPEVGFTPNINQEMMNVIIFTDEDREIVGNFYKKRASLDPLQKPKQPIFDAKTDTPKSSRPKFTIKGAETQKREANKQILQNMLFKTIKEKNDKLLSGENQEELTNEIKSLLHINMHNFQALKGITSVNDNVTLGHMINGLLKRKTDHDKLTAFEKDSSKNVNDDKDSKKPLLDYKLAEAALLKKFQECVGEIQKIRDKIDEINHESYLLRVEIKQLSAEKEELLKKFDQLEEEILNENKERAQGIGRRKAVDRGNLEDYMKLQKIRADRKKQEAVYVEKLDEAEKKIQNNNEIINQRETELRNMKQLKAHYKLQVKELYHKTLQDSADLLNPDNGTNYTSVIVSAWNMHEDINENNLATFLEKETASFMIQNAKQLWEFEKFCKEVGMPSALDTLDAIKEEGIELRLPNINTTATGTLDRTQLYAMNKDLSHLLKDVKERMHLIKKREIKAKRYVTMQSPHKLKEKIIREEDVNLVDPIELDNRFSHRDYVIGAFPSNKSRDSSNENRNQMKNFTDQTNEMVKKIEALKKAEIARLYKVNLAKNLDERLKENLKKTFRYAFGKKDAEELLSRFMKEKRKALGGGGAEKQIQNQDEKMTKMLGLKAISTARSGLDLKSPNRSGLLNYNPLPPLDQSRSTISVRKNSFVSNNESMVKPQVIQINESP